MSAILSSAEAEFVSDHWRELHDRLAVEWDGQIPMDALIQLWRHGLVIDTLSQSKYAACVDHFGVDEVIRLCAEPPVPHVVRTHEGIDPTAVHHLYHLARWEQTVGDLRDIGTVVEWGGGYGSFARLCLRRNPDLEYVMIDLPVLRTVQRWFLNLCGFGNCEQVRFVPPTQTSEVKGDLFVSTWALDESSEMAQRTVVDGGFFGAAHGLMALGSWLFPDHDSLLWSLPAAGVEMPDAPDSVYVLW